MRFRDPNAPLDDPEGDRMEEQDRADRMAEKGSLVMDPNPIDPCRECGVMPKELAPGFWVCVCSLGRPA